MSKRKQLASIDTSKSIGPSPLAQDSGSSRMAPAVMPVPSQDAPKRRLFLVVPVTAILVGVFISIIAYIFFISAGTTVGICVSDSCKEHAKRLLKTINTSVDPCKNFYAFACGGWKREFPALSVLEKMNQDAKKNEIIELDDDLWNQGKAAQLYHKCAEPQKPHSISGIDTLIHFMDEVGLMWPFKDSDDAPFHPLEVMLSMAASFDVNFQFRLQVMISKVLGHILIFRRRYNGVVWKHRLEHLMNTDEYASVIHDHMAVLGLPNLQYDAVLLHKLEIFFTEATHYKKSKGEQWWLTFDELDTKTPNIRDVEWHHLLNRQYRITLRRRWNPKDWVVVEDSLLLTKLDELFRTYNESEIFMGTAWMFIQSHLWAVAGKPELMFRDNVNENRQLACLEYVNSVFGLLPSTEYLTQLFPTHETRRNVNRFTQSLKNEFVSKVNRAAWIDHEIAGKAVRKIKSTDLNILPSEQFFVSHQRAALYEIFPDISNFSFVVSWLVSAEKYGRLQNDARFYDIYQKRRTFHQQPYTYAYLPNSVDAVMVALEAPLFYINGTFAMNYAGSGFLLAREIAKTIDPLGTTVTLYGENTAWWGKTHSAEYYRRTQCELGQEAGLPQMGVFPAIPALEVSFSAFKTSVQQHSHRADAVNDLRLEGLGEYGDDQVFFMTYCYALCSKEGDTNSQQECNVPLRHFYPFAEAFKCPEGSPMNLKTKCGFFN
ncbi:neprilysin-2-like [Dermacentor albipictus]|uniref:neprilysin-2-like n=1 Tax=Dermacentor albipictus TaxID=60249 RepID=UPI0038FC73D1